MRGNNYVKELYADLFAGVHYVATQHQFNRLIERVAANNYRIKSDIRAVHLGYLSGGYQCYGSDSFLSGGDTWAAIQLNQCTYFVMQNGAYLAVGDNPFYFRTVDTDNLYMKNVWVKGEQSIAAAIEYTFLLEDANYVIFDNCKVTNRLSNVPMVGFKESSIYFNNKTALYKNCSVSDLTGVYINGFGYCQNLINCKEDNEPVKSRKKMHAPFLIGDTTFICSCPRIARMTDNTLSIVDREADTLYYYEWNGIDFEVVGSGISVGTIGSGSVADIATMFSTRVAVANGTTPSIQAYDWSGTAWSTIGSAYALTGTIEELAVCGRNSTDIVYVDTANSELTMLRFDGSTWSIIGTPYDLSGYGSLGNIAICKLNNTDFVVYLALNVASNIIQTFRFDDSTGLWSTFGGSYTVGDGQPAIASRNETDIVYLESIDSTILALRYHDTELNWQPLGISYYVTPASNPSLVFMNNQDLVEIDGTAELLRCFRYSFEDA